VIDIHTLSTESLVDVSSTLLPFLSRKTSNFSRRWWQVNVKTFK